MQNVTVRLDSVEQSASDENVVSSFMNVESVERFSEVCEEGKVRAVTHKRKIIISREKHYSILILFWEWILRGSSLLV